MKSARLPDQLAASAFAAADSEARERLCEVLASSASNRLILASEALWHEAIESVIAELRVLGHDLWSFDEDRDFQAWCGDWTRPAQEFELVISFRRPAWVRVIWKAPSGMTSAEAGGPYTPSQA